MGMLNPCNNKQNRESQETLERINFLWNNKVKQDTLLHFINLIPKKLGSCVECKQLEEHFTGYLATGQEEDVVQKHAGCISGTLPQIIYCKMFTTPFRNTDVWPAFCFSETSFKGKKSMAHTDSSSIIAAESKKSGLNSARSRLFLDGGWKDKSLNRNLFD